MDNFLFSRVKVAKNNSASAAVTDGCGEMILTELSHEYGILTMISSKYLENCFNFGLFATISHGCEGENILRNHESWLRKIFFPSQPCVTVAKRLISWDFPTIFMKISWLLKTCVYLWIWQKKKSQFHFSFFKVDSQNPKFNLEYLLCIYK